MSMIGDFFSRYEVTNTMGFMPLFPDDGKHTYYTGTINRMVATAKTIDSAFIGASLVGINKQLSFKSLDRLGGVSTSNISLQEVNEEQALIILQGVDPTAVSIENFTSRKQGGFSDVNNYIYRDNAYKFGTARACYLSEAEQAISGEPYTYYWMIEGTWKKLVSTGDVHIDKYNNATWNAIYKDDLGGTSTVGATSNYIAFKRIDYTSSDPYTCPEGTGYHRMHCIDDSYLPIEETSEEGVMAVRYKVGGAINDAKYLRALSARLGIPNRELPKDCVQLRQDLVDELTAGRITQDEYTEQHAELEDCEEYKTLKEGLEDPDLRTQILTYAVKYEDPYKELIDDMLGTSSFVNIEIPGIEYEGPDGQTYTSDGTLISYSTFGFGHTARDLETGYTMYVDGNQVNIHPDEDAVKAGAIEQAARYMIPIENINKVLNMKQKYDLVEDGLCWFVHNQTKTKRKWYQTGLFKIIMWVIAIVLAIYGNPMMLIGLVGSTIAGGIWGAKGAMIFGIIFAVFTLGTSLLSAPANMLSTFSMAASIASQIANVYFTFEMEDIMAEAKEIADDSREVKEAIQEFGKEMLYIPFSDQVDALFYTMYELTYDIYGEAYNYDSFTKISTLKDYSKINKGPKS